MFYVYMLNSEKVPKHFYVGRTKDLRRRFQEHNRGDSSHTANLRPWKLVTYVAFSDEARAVAFERYLKSRSGRAFSKRHL